MANGHIRVKPGGIPPVIWQRTGGPIPTFALPVRQALMQMLGIEGPLANIGFWWSFWI
jgi:hypothetical protein